MLLAEIANNAYKLIAIIFIILSQFLVLAILKKNYTRLCHCLPQDYMNTMNILKELVRPSDDQVRKWMDIAAANFFNETAVGMIISVIKSDAHALYFCDIMEKLCDSKSSKMYIETLRKGNFIIIQ